MLLEPLLNYARNITQVTPKVKGSYAARYSCSRSRNKFVRLIFNRLHSALNPGGSSSKAADSLGPNNIGKPRSLQKKEEKYGCLGGSTNIAHYLVRKMSIGQLKLCAAYFLTPL